MIKAIMFDLDGTLVPLKDDEFIREYFRLLCKKLMPVGYDKDLLIKTVMEGDKLMRLNDGKQTNEVVFWNHMAEVYGDEKRADERIFHEFYLNEFKQIQVVAGQNDKAREVVDFCKSKGLKVIVATSPVFPVEAMVARLGFVGLKEDEFDYITSYETCSYSKPNPKFFEEILAKNGLSADEVLYFGNSEKDDGIPATAVGIKSFMVGNQIIVDENNPNKFKHYDFDEIIDIIDENTK